MAKNLAAGSLILPTSVFICTDDINHFIPHAAYRLRILNDINVFEKLTIRSNHVSLGRLETVNRLLRNHRLRLLSNRQCLMTSYASLVSHARSRAIPE